MSKAFTKEDDGTAKVRLDDLPQSPHPNLVTAKGLADLNARLTARKDELSALKAQADEIDVSHAIAVAERDIRFLGARVSSAILVDLQNRKSDVVTFGAQVEVQNEDGARQTFWIVGEDEADPARGLISPYSPLGVAMIGAEVGDIVEWRKPNGGVELEIMSIQFQ